MHWLGRIILIIAGNALGLWLAGFYVPGFIINASFPQLLFIALVLAILNAILKPILTLIFGPIIVLTLGLGIIVVNAVILLLLQFFSNHIDILTGGVIIQSIPALIYATLVLGIINFVIHLAIER